MGILQAGGKGFCVHSSSLHGVAWACEAYGGFGFRKISARISRRDNFNSNGPCVAIRSWRWLSTYKVTPINPPEPIQRRGREPGSPLVSPAPWIWVVAGSLPPLFHTSSIISPLRYYARYLSNLEVSQSGT